MFTNKVKFDHVNVVISIILGLSIEKLLARSAPLLVNNNYTHATVVQIIWIFNLLLAQIQFWWSMNKYADKEVGFSNYFGFLISPVLMYLMSTLVIPDDIDSATSDYFGSVSLWFYTLGVAVVISNMINAWLIGSAGCLPGFFQVILIVMFLFRLKFDNDIYDFIVGFGTTILLLLITWSRP